jgi:hypothetical protein
MLIKKIKRKGKVDILAASADESGEGRYLSFFKAYIIFVFTVCYFKFKN